MEKGMILLRMMGCIGLALVSFRMAWLPYDEDSELPDVAFGSFLWFGLFEWVDAGCRKWLPASLHPVVFRTLSCIMGIVMLILGVACGWMAFR